MTIAFSKEWFEKHNRIICWFANSFFGQFIFRFRKMGHYLENKIVKITPSSVAELMSIKDDKIELREHFSSRNIYAMRLRKTFRPIWLLFHAWDMLIANKFAPQLNLGFDTEVTFNPDAHVESTSVDGDVRYISADDTWANIHDAVNGNAAYDDAQDNYLGFVQSDGALNDWKQIIRGIWLFNISSISGETIVSAIFSGYVYSVNTGFANQSISLVDSAPASNDDLVVGDYSSLGTTRYATDVALGDLTIDQYNDWPLNGTGVTFLQTAVDGDGIVKLGTRMASDLDNTPPTWISDTYSGAPIRTADSVSGNFPKLIVTYSVGVAATGNMFMMFS